MNRENIINIVNYVFQQYARKDFGEKDNLCREHFFSEELRIEPRNLVLVLLNLEERFSIRFSDDFLVRGGFSSFYNVVEYLDSNLKKDLGEEEKNAWKTNCV